MESQRKCTSCGMVRIPTVEVVKQGNKKWTIYTCSICKLRDIEPYVPKKEWDYSSYETRAKEDGKEG